MGCPREEPSHTHPLWPVTCGCGYIFKEDDNWQLFQEEIYSRSDTGEEMLLRDAPPGAMWYADWMPSDWKGADGHCLMVRLPNKRDWMVDGPASNCTKVGDKTHRCWCRHGDVPFITVDKKGQPTCDAGAGSILSGDWHGFLRNGILAP